MMSGGQVQDIMPHSPEELKGKVLRQSAFCLNVLVTMFNSESDYDLVQVAVITGASSGIGLATACLMCVVWADRQVIQT